MYPTATMGQKQTKEETIVVQNSAAGDNHSEAINFHMTTTNIILGIIFVIILMGVFYIIYRMYKGCMTKWINKQITRTAIRKSFFHREMQSRAPEGSRVYPDLQAA